MRQYILTETEREEIESFLKGKNSSVSIRLLKYRAKKFLPTIKNDIETLEKLLAKMK